MNHLIGELDSEPPAVGKEELDMLKEGYVNKTHFRLDSLCDLARSAQYASNQFQGLFHPSENIEKAKIHPENGSEWER